MLKQGSSDSRTRIVAGAATDVAGVTTDMAGAPTDTDDKGDSAATVVDCAGNMVDALIFEAAPQDLLECQLPSSYRAAHLLREDESVFDGQSEKDIRRSLHVGEVPMPELAPVTTTRFTRS